MENKSLENMSDDELLALHAKEFGLESLNDDQLQRLHDFEKVKEVQKEPPSFMETTTRRAAKLLPAAGGMAGAALGGPVGAAAGAMGGTGLKNIIESYGFEEPKTRQQIYGEPITEAAGAALGEAAAPEIGAIIGKGVSALGSGIKKTASNLSMIPEKVLETYYKYGPEVEKVTIAPGETGIAEAVNKFRQEANTAIQQFKNLKNTNISKAIEEKGHEMVDVTPAIRSIEENIQKINPKISPEKVKPLQDMLDMINDLSTHTTHYKNGTSEKLSRMSATDAYAMQQKLQNMAEYLPTGEIKRSKDFADITLQRAASRLRGAVKNVVPEISAATEELAKLKRVGKKFNPNILTENAPYPAVMGIGTAENQMNRLQLEKIGNIIGKDLVGDTEKLAAAQYMNNAGFLPNIKTGARAIIPQVMAGAAGELAAGNVGAMMSVAGTAAMSSPLIIKQTIKAAGAIARTAPNQGKEIIQKLIQSGIQSGFSPMMMDSFVRDSDEIPPTAKAFTRREIGKGQ